MYSYEDALQASVDYFGGELLPAQTFLEKYALRDDQEQILEKTPDAMHRRMSKEFARIELKKFKKPYTEEEIYGWFKNFGYMIPQGSPMYAIGNPYKYVTSSNCYVIHSPEDSYGGILKTDQEIVQISKRRGGVGWCLDNIRPAGVATKNSSRTSTGIIPFAHRFSNSVREVGQDGRRGASMQCLSVHHPQVLDFARSKLDDVSITGSNISIKLTNAFMNAVEKKEQYKQFWTSKDKKTHVEIMAAAEEVWDEIIRCAWERAEPGLLFWDLILAECPANCYPDFMDEATNPCAELPICPDDSCRLMILNLLKFVSNPFTSKAVFEYEKFYDFAQKVQRLMDDLIDLELECIDRIINKIESDPESETIKAVELALWKRIKVKCAGGRRTGTGLTAVGDTLAALGIPYASDEGINTIAGIYQTLKFGCYRSSIDMAKELGTFPVWDKELEKNNKFLNRFKKETLGVNGINGFDLWSDMQKYGRRNIALLTQAPTGTVSLMAEVEHPIHGTSSGIEPTYTESYKRRRKINPNDTNAIVDFVDKSGDKWQEYEVFHPAVQVWSKTNVTTDLTKSPWSGSCASDINWQQRVKLQAAVQKHIDHSISSTINLPNSATKEDVRLIYETAWKSGCKGMTVYRDGCRTGVLIKKDEVKDCIIKNQAPKRPDTIECDVFHTSVKKVEYFVVVGTICEDPYEVFAGENIQDQNRILSKDIKKGSLKKIKRGHYKLFNPDGEAICDNVNYFVSDNEEAICRLVSTALRHGSDVSFIVQQLEKIQGGMENFARALTRILKKYILDGVKVTGAVCGTCGQNTLIRQEGCVTCTQCGWAKCG